MAGAFGLGFFGIIWLTVMLLTFGGLIIGIWALVDLLQKPEWAWPYAGENRTMYIVLLAGSFFVCQPLAWIPGIMYFKGAKPRVVAVLAQVPAPTYPGYGPPGYGPPGGVGQGAYPPPGYGPPTQPWQAQQPSWAPQQQPDPQSWQAPGVAGPGEQANPTTQSPDYPSSGPVGE